MEIARIISTTLHRDAEFSGLYIILNDGNYLTGFYADGDKDAVRYFYSKEWALGF